MIFCWIAGEDIKLIDAFFKIDYRNVYIEGEILLLKVMGILSLTLMRP